MGQPRPRARKWRAMAPMLSGPRFEILPLPGVLDQIDMLPPGSVVTVTASPRQGPAATVDHCMRLAELGMSPVPHLAARQYRDATELSATLDRLEDLDVRDIFVVGGDSSAPVGEFADGLALLRAIDRRGHRFERVGVPSYPDGHYLIDTETLWDALVAKQVYASYTVTQLCFDPNAVCRFAAEARTRGITLPIVAGVPGVVDVTKLLRVSLRIGVGDSVRFVRGNRGVTALLLSPGGYRPDGLIRKLGVQVAEGRCELTGLHIYTFNQVGATVRWLQNTRRRLAAVS